MRSLRFALISILIPIVIFIAQDFIKVDRVSDGDTFEFSNREKVRLIGVNTPKTIQPNKLI